MIGNRNAFVRAIYPYANYTGKYTVGGILFDETIGIDNNFHFYVYANSTYDKCYEKRDIYNDETFRHHQTEIQNAVSNAIRRYSMKSMSISMLSHM